MNAFCHGCHRWRRLVARPRTKKAESDRFGARPHGSSTRGIHSSGIGTKFGTVRPFPHQKSLVRIGVAESIVFHGWRRRQNRDNDRSRWQGMGKEVDAAALSPPLMMFLGPTLTVGTSGCGINP